MYILFSLILTFIITVILTLFFIKQRLYNFSSLIRDYTPKEHIKKNNTPTMGGIIIIASIIINILLWSDIQNNYIIIFLINMLGFGFIGALDDLMKIHKNKGITARIKFVLQCLIASFTFLCLYIFTPITPILVFPFFSVNIGIFYFLWVLFIIVGTSNAVNITDGLDGLASTSIAINSSIFSVICFFLYLQHNNIQEFAVVTAIMAGACLGFLWFNAYPAKLFMGDVGSLSLGASIAFIALITKTEIILLPFTGIIFVIEILSVIMQVASFKIRRKKIFKMAPIHHHFEIIGWPEQLITTRFSLVTLLSSLIALSLLLFFHS